MKRSKVELLQKESKATVSEIFYSYQGEGIFFGEPQIFVRFYGCNIKCNYCDTRKNTYRLCSVSSVLGAIKKLMRQNINAFSSLPQRIVLTGGEPLLQKPFLKQLLPKLKKLGLSIFLETNGTLYKNLNALKEYVDIISMDIKTPSACNNNLWRLQKNFLKVCPKKVYVKIVVSRNTKDLEISNAVNLVSSISNNIPFVFQPVTANKIKNIPSLNTFEKFADMAKRKLNKVYLIPQLHKIWNVR